MVKRLWFGGCFNCGRWYSKFGLGLITSVIYKSDGYSMEPGIAVPYHSCCIECDRLVHPLCYTIDMRSIFEQVDRIPWVPTEEESKWWALWNIDHWFARRAA